MRVKFSEVFAIGVNGMISPKLPVNIGGVQMGPGVSFGGGVAFGGIQLASIAGHDLEIDRAPNGVVTLKGHYPPGS